MDRQADTRTKDQVNDCPDGSCHETEIFDIVVERGEPDVID